MCVTPEPRTLSHRPEQAQMAFALHHPSHAHAQAAEITDGALLHFYDHGVSWKLDDQRCILRDLDSTGIEGC